MVIRGGGCGPAAIFLNRACSDVQTTHLRRQRCHRAACIAVHAAIAEEQGANLCLLLIRIQVVIYIQPLSEREAISHAANEREFYHVLGLIPHENGVQKLRKK